MFLRSAAQDTLQGQAIAKINRTWGTDSLCRAGRETIGIPVCKKKYKPFAFTTSAAGGSKNSKTRITVERLYACPCHHAARKQVIEQHGVRKNWQPFGVWSLRKAQEQARVASTRLLPEGKSPSSPATTAAAAGKRKRTSIPALELPKGESRGGGGSSSSSSSTKRSPAVAQLKCDDEEAEDDTTGPPTTTSTAAILNSICINGDCTWKVKSAYDDIFKEIHGYSESEDEDG